MVKMRLKKYVLANTSNCCWHQEKLENCHNGFCGKLQLFIVVRDIFAY